MRTMERLQSFLCWFTRFLFVTDKPATNLIFWWFGNFFCFNDDDFTLCGRGLVFGVQAGPVWWNRHSIINSPDSSDGNNMYVISIRTIRYTRFDHIWGLNYTSGSSWPGKSWCWGKWGKPQEQGLGVKQVEQTDFYVFTCCESPNPRVVENNIVTASSHISWPWS